MALRLSTEWANTLAQLRYQPVLKRVRVLAGDVLVADSQAPALVWEPRRVVPSYAVPVKDLRVAASPATGSPAAELAPVALGDGPPVLDPRTGFAAHTAPGTPMALEVDGQLLDGVGFRLDDPEVDDYIVLDFDAFSWLEEDEPVVGHPRDPFHRIDIRQSGRAVRIEHAGTLLAQSRRALFLFEGIFPMVRYYLPREDVAVELSRSDHTTTCAYKGRATHWSVGSDPALQSIAWSYEEPLSDAIPIAGLVSFYTERLDLAVDGQPIPRPKTPWSKPDA
jgi:uncharacterized protein (DUF427 family)